MSTRVQSSSYFRGRGVVRKPRNKPLEEDCRQKDKEKFIGEVEDIVRVIKSSHLPNREEVLRDIRHIISRIPHTCFRILRGELRRVLEKGTPRRGEIFLGLESVMAGWPKD
ncbi:MAG: hypothetical protein WC095_00145 [Candidatus Paceibacterota bacterium]